MEVFIVSHSYGLVGAFSTMEAARKAAAAYRKVWPEGGTVIRACQLDPDTQPSFDRVIEIHSGQLGDAMSGTVRVFGR